MTNKKKGRTREEVKAWARQQAIELEKASAGIDRRSWESYQKWAAEELSDDEEAAHGREERNTGDETKEED